MTKVSVVIAGYNAGRWLAETLDSVMAQTHDDLEVVFVDDGSTDDTQEVLEPYRSRITVIPQENAGLATARNVGVAASTGSHVALLDADDLWHPTKVAEQVALAEQHPESGLFACDVEVFDQSGTTLVHLFRPRLLRQLRRAPGGSLTADRHAAFIRRQLIACPAQTLIPRWALDAVGPFVESGAQDYDCYLRLAQRFPVTLHHPVLVRWRNHDTSMSGAVDRRAFLWALMTIPVLEAHSRRTRGLDRLRVRRHLQRLTTRRAIRALQLGIVEDRAFARGFVDELVRLRPVPSVRLCRVVLARWPSRSPAER